MPTYDQQKRLREAVQKAELSYEFAKRAAAREEGNGGDPPASLAAVLAGVEPILDRALAQLRATPRESLLDDRTVGRAGLPSNVLGLLFHAAEHAPRHAGQALTTSKILMGS